MSISKPNDFSAWQPRHLPGTVELMIRVIAGKNSKSWLRPVVRRDNQGDIRLRTATIYGPGSLRRRRDQSMAAAARRSILQLRNNNCANWAIKVVHHIVLIAVNIKGEI